MLFDEIKIDTITHEDELYINVEQLYNHILGSVEIFSSETELLAKAFGISRDEKYFVRGLVEGMWSIAMMLGYGNKQYQFDSVTTVDDLIKRFWDKKNHMNECDHDYQIWRGRSVCMNCGEEEK